MLGVAVEQIVYFVLLTIGFVALILYILWNQRVRIAYRLRMHKKKGNYQLWLETIKMQIKSKVYQNQQLLKFSGQKSNGEEPRVKDKIMILLKDMHIEDDETMLSNIDISLLLFHIKVLAFENDSLEAPILLAAYPKINQQLDRILTDVQNNMKVYKNCKNVQEIQTFFNQFHIDNSKIKSINNLPIPVRYLLYYDEIK